MFLTDFEKEVVTISSDDVIMNVCCLYVSDHFQNYTVAARDYFSVGGPNQKSFILV